MRTPVVLHALSSFDDTILGHTAPAIIAGLSACLSAPTPLRSEITNSPDFWSILQRLHNHKMEAENVFEILANIAGSEPSAVTADNYEATVSLANDFATMGSVGAILEQRKQNPHQRRQQQQQPQRKGQKQGETPANEKPTPEKVPDEQIIVQRALKALSLIYSLTSLTPSFIKQSHLDRNEAWAAYWSPIFRALCAQSVNPCREIRRRAVTALQRVLLGEDLAYASSSQHRRSDSINSAKSVESETTSDDGEGKTSRRQEWTSLFTEVLFPLILRLLKPEIYQLDTLGMGETRVQCATLLTKIFLRYLDLLTALPPMIIEKPVESSSPSSKEPALGQQNSEALLKPATIKESRPWVLDIWTKTLQLLERLMNAGMGQREQEVMTEAVSEGVKNCVLVMAGSGYLERPSSHESVGKGVESGGKEKEKLVLWRETMRRVERVVPGLWGELFPDPPPGSAPGAEPPTAEVVGEAAASADGEHSGK
jgi:golgi-specific brefeldin A-resistance guanine nucleotide exchange factor 1